MRALILSVLLLAGCASRLPTYAPMDPYAAWRIIRDASAATPGLVAEADVLLAGSDGSRLRADAALVLAPPARLRLRAWKMGHAVLDVTADGEGVWLDATEGADGRPMIDALAPELLVDGILFHTPWKLNGIEPSHAVRRGERYVVEFEGISCEIDVRTLVPLRWTSTNGGETFVLDLADHRLISDIPVAHVLTLADGTRSVRVRLSHVALTDEIDPRAFSPPNRAEKMR